MDARHRRLGTGVSGIFACEAPHGGDYLNRKNFFFLLSLTTYRLPPHDIKIGT